MILHRLYETGGEVVECEYLESGSRKTLVAKRSLGKGKEEDRIVLNRAVEFATNTREMEEMDVEWDLERNNEILDRQQKKYFQSYIILLIIQVQILPKPKIITKTADLDPCLRMTILRNKSLCAKTHILEN